MMKSHHSIPIVIQKDQVVLTQRAICRLIRELDKRIIPFLAVLELPRFGFQVAIGHAELTTFHTDLNLTTAEHNWATSAFFLACLTFSIPSSLLLRLIGAKNYLSLSLFCWGAITIGMAFVKNGHQLIILRFFLGMVIAGYFPGIITYLSLWYRKRERIMRIAIFCTATFAAGIFNGFLAYGTSKLHGVAGLKYWQWLCLLPGLPILPLGIITYFILGNLPETVQWLNNSQKELLTNTLRTDAGVTNSESESDSLLSWRQVRYVFIDWKIYLYAVISIGVFSAKKCLITYLPSMVESMGYTEVTMYSMTVIPYVLSCFAILLSSYSLFRHNEYAFHLAHCLSISLFGFILMIIFVDKYKLCSYVSLCIACCGTFSSIPILLSWLANNVGGNTKRTISIGVISGIGQIGGIFETDAYSEMKEPTYQRGHIIISAFLAGAIIFTFILRFCLVMENRRREHLSSVSDEYKREVEVKECGDWHPDNRYDV